MICNLVGLSVPYCELSGGKFRYDEPSLVDHSWSWAWRFSADLCAVHYVGGYTGGLQQCIE